MNPLIQSKNITILAVFIALTLGCFGLSPTARAVDPPPDGGYPGDNTAEGEDALFSLTTGIDNTAIGHEALLNNTTGNDNTAVGSGAMQSSVTSFNNTAIGWQALQLGTGFNGNTAVGYRALRKNTFGSANTAIGTVAMGSNTEGAVNTAVGNAALGGNTTGNYNAAFGLNALNKNTTGFTNTALGSVAMEGNISGTSNTAVGYFALVKNTNGSSNIALGANAGSTLEVGNDNIAMGSGAGINLIHGDNNIYIGNPGDSSGESAKIRIGTIGTHTATFIAGISGTTVGGGVGVIINSNGKLGTIVSSERFKDNVQPMDKLSEAILALKPVTFRYKKDLDPDGVPQFGLVAEQVEKVNPELVAYDDHGKPYSVRYEAVNAMLLNEFLKEHRKVEELTKEFQATVAQQQKQIEALTAGLQKVSAQLEVSKAAPQVVNNP
jgi:hypothetical protein